MFEVPTSKSSPAGGVVRVRGRGVSFLVAMLCALVASLGLTVGSAAASDDSQAHVAVDGNGDVTAAAQALLFKMTPARWSQANAAVHGQLQGSLVGTLLPATGTVMDWNAGSVRTRKVCSALFASCWFYTRDQTGVQAPQWPIWKATWDGANDGNCPGFSFACHFTGPRKNVYVSQAVLEPYSWCNTVQPTYVGFEVYSSQETTSGYCPYPTLITGIHARKWVLPDSAGLSLEPRANDAGVPQDYAGPIPYDGGWVRALGLALAEPLNSDARDWICHQINPHACADPTGVPAPGGPGARQLWGGAGGPGNAATPNVPRCGAADPVDCATGNFYETQTDVSVAGKGLDLEFTRTYNAQDGASASSAGLIGWGWSANWTDRVLVDPETTQATVVASDGSRTTFYPRGSSYDAAPWVQSRLTRQPDGTYRYVLPDQQVWAFSSAGVLTSKRDGNGNTTTVSADLNGKPLTVTDPGGRTLSFTYNTAGRISRVDAPGPRNTLYGYDTAGNLTSFTDVKGGVWQFGYDGSHRMTSMTDPRGAVTTNVYDGADRVTSQTDPLTRVTQFAYQGSTTTVTDPRGIVTEREFTNNEPTKVTSAKGTLEETIKTIVYDASGNPTKVTDERGNDWIYTYDSDGNRTSAKDPLLRTTAWTYDSAHHVLTSTLPSGLLTTYTYDTAGNLKTTSRTYTESGQTQTTALDYDASGQLTSKTDPLGHAWTYAYDSAGNLTSQTSPLGNKTTFAYDAAGFVTSRVTPKGNTTGGTPVQYQTTYTRDAFGDATQVTDPRGKVTLNTFDANGNLTDVTDRDGRHTNTTYDLLNRPTAVLRGDGSTVATGYDEDGNVTSQTDGLLKVTSYSYDKHNRVISTTDPLSRTTAFGYDAVGNRTTLTDASSRVTTWTYNVANELTLAHASSGSPADAAFTYTPDGLRLSMSDETGTTNWTYDSLNRLKTFKNANDQTITYTYDLAGRNLTIAYPPALVPGAPGSTPTTVATGTVTRTFDDDDRMQTVKDWLNKTTTYSYDPNSNISTIARPNATTATNLYDANDVLTKITDTGTGFSRVDTYTRTDSELLATQTETGTAAQPNPIYGYDLNARLTSTGATANQTYQYDAGDNPTKIVRATVTANQSFDNAHQLTAVKNAANATTASFAYNAQGERTTFTNTANGFVTTYAYDQAGQLRTFTGKDTAGAALTQTYGYDGTDTRRWRQAANVRTHHTWDPSGELALMIQDGSTSYIYGPEGVPIEQILSGGTLRQLHHDQLGSIRAVTSSTRSVVGAYSYDPYGKQLTATGSGAAANAFRYAGQYTDTTGLQYLRARYYDPTTAQFLTRDPIEPETRSAYGYAAGSPVNYTDPSGLWPSLQGISDAIASAGDEITLGLTKQIRQAIGSDGTDYCSSAYAAGGAAGVALSLALPGPGKLKLAARGGGRAVGAATPIGRRGNPMNVPRGTNAPTTIGGRAFSGHAIDQMQGRGIMPSVVENAIRNGVRTAGSEAGTFRHVFEGVRVITNEAGRVITVIG